MRKYGSLVVCPLRARLFQNSPVVRVALHPMDFEHSLTMRNIEYVLKMLIADRQYALPEKLDWASLA